MDSTTPATLTLEQKFALRHFSDKVQNLTEADAKELLVEMYESTLQRENYYKTLIKHDWGL